MTVEILEKTVLDSIADSDCDVKVLNCLCVDDYSGFVLTLEEKTFSNPFFVCSNYHIYHCGITGNVTLVKTFGCRYSDECLAKIAFAILCDDVDSVRDVIHFSVDLMQED